MDDADLGSPEFLERLRQRDPPAWEALVDAYLPQLLRAGRGMGFASDESLDLAQSVFVAMMEAIARFEGRSHIRTFLFGVFYNKVSEHLREKHRAELSDPIDEVMEARFDAAGKWRQPPLDIEKAVFAREVREMVQGCLETVPRAKRIAFYLSRNFHYEIRPVRERTTWPPQNAMGRPLGRCPNFRTPPPLGA